ncbi:MAG: TRAP transporter large permease subunit [Spirochaetaceae bacterium]|jgi:tripartite ATP-independent transporter DctM subunit|nr:TRAP transporter large permease subunit [Spirochaetaceae bacterium]
MDKTNSNSKHRFGICITAAAVLVLAALPVIESFVKLFFKRSIPFSTEIIMQMLMITSCVSGVIAVRKKEHLSIGLVQYIKNESVKSKLMIVTNMLSACVSAMLAVCSAVYIRVALDHNTMIGFIPQWIFSVVMPLCFMVMSFYFARALPFSGKKKLLAFIPALFSLFCSLPLIAQFIWLFDLPESMLRMHDVLTVLIQKTYVPVICFIVLCAIAGAPLFIVFGSLAMVLFAVQDSEVAAIIVNVESVLTNVDYSAIPLFALVGFFLSESKAGIRMVETFRAFFGWFRGGLIAAATLICAFFTTFTGASGVTILALGGILFSILTPPKDSARAGSSSCYPASFSRGLLTSTGSIGLLFPPSLPIILVGITMQQSIIKFFMAGILPGILLICAMVVFGIIISFRAKIPIEKFNFLYALKSLKNSIFELMLPFLLLAGFFSGILSISEIGAAALVYIFIIEVFVKRDIPLRAVPGVFAKGLPIIGGILMILSLSKALSEYIVFIQAPEIFADWMQRVVSSKIVFLLLLNVVLLITGCLMDIFSAFAVMLPLIVPLGAVYGIDPLHLGIIFLINLEAGYLTPPVGLNLFLASYRFERPFIEICRNVWPFLLIQLCVVVLVTYIPVLSTGLPKLF